MWAEAGLWDNNRYTAGTRRRNRYLRKKTDTKKERTATKEGGRRMGLRKGETKESRRLSVGRKLSKSIDLSTRLIIKSVRSHKKQKRKEKEKEEKTLVTDLRVQ